MSFFSKSSGILGINARNLLYLYRYNSRANKKLADDKLFTKRFLSARGIGAAKLYATIRSHTELKNFNPASLPKSFIIKPNRGYGGEGIIPIINHTGGSFRDLNGERYAWQDLAQHCLSILDGQYAVSGLRDQVLFEELLQPDPFFAPYIEYGLPDIRLIIFKYVPVMAMLRLPTAESKGKANLHLGAVGLGIDIGTGRTTFGVRHNRFLKRLPSGHPVSSLVIPSWDELLMLASRTQAISQIGYLAVDLTVSATGIQVLELNARAGLAIQICNQALLRKRLEKIGDLKVVSPQEGVRLGKTLFTRVIKKEPTKEAKSTRPVIGLYEYVTLINVSDNAVLAKIDPHLQMTTIDTSLPVPPDGKLLTVKIHGNKIRIPYRREALGLTPYKIVISGKHLTDFLIDATRTIPEYRTTESAATRDEKIIQNIDAKLAAINEQLMLLSRLKPSNLAAEQSAFMKHPVRSPQFTYQTGDLDTLALRNDLKKVPRQVNHPLMPLFVRKIDEITKKLALIESVGRPEITENAVRVFGDVTDEHYQAALQSLRAFQPTEDTSKKIRLDDVVARLTALLRERQLNGWRIKILDTATAGMQVTKKGVILVSRTVHVTENRWRAMVAHEIETHVYRLENGRLQRYRLFAQGTEGYLSTEEGLAIFNQQQLGLPLGMKDAMPAINVIAIRLGMQMSFVDLYHHLINVYGLTPPKAWKTCVRAKRGLADTDAPGANTKDAVYFLGHRRIRRFIEENGQAAIRQLYVGKIDINDLEYLGDTRQWPVRYLPDYLSPDAPRAATVRK